MKIKQIFKLNQSLFKITRIDLAKIMQNLIVLMEPSEEAWETPLKGGNMIFNRLCIDENAAFELSGVNFLKTSSDEMASKYQIKRSAKGKEFSF